MRIRLILLALMGASLALLSPAGTAAQPQGCPDGLPFRLAR